MKKTILFATIYLAIVHSTVAQNVNIPDANFKAYLIGNSSYNTNSDTEIQVSEAEAITYLNLNNKNIADLTGIEAFVNLVSLQVSDNQLSSIDVSQNTLLSGLNVSNNLLTSIDVSQNPLLNGLGCNGNNISSLDVTQNTNLVSLYCHINNISVLDLSQNTALISLVCYQNNISILDLSNTSINQNTTLEIPYIDCKQNNLTVLKMNNISTTALEGQYFFATSNPNLTCIDVDDATAATSAWTNIDATASFSLNCQVDLVSSIAVQGQSGASFINTNGGTLQMNADVLPTYADDDTYSWSLTNGTGSASIDASGLLTAISNGTVTVTATANDASGVTGSAIITISNQTSVGINEQHSQNSLSLYPNPANEQLTIDFEGEIYTIEIVDLTGKTLKKLNPSSKNINVTELPSGIYLLQVESENNSSTERFIKK